MLVLEEWISQSDDDLEIWASVSVGFDSEKKLAVKLEYIDYEDESNNKLVCAFVSFEDAYNMAKLLNVRLTELPRVVRERCGRRSATMVPSQVESCFREVLDFIVSYGIRYKLCQ